MPLPPRQRLIIAACVAILVLVVALSVKRLTSPNAAGSPESSLAAQEQDPYPDPGAGNSTQKRGKRTTKVFHLSTPDPNPSNSKKPEPRQPAPEEEIRITDKSTSEEIALAMAAMEKRIAHRRLFGYMVDRSRTEEDQAPEIRTMISRTKNDMRSMATGIESYYIDNNSYPAMTTNTSRMQVTGYSVFGPVPGPLTYKPGEAMTLTTPIAYLTSYFKDPFATNPADTFAYYRDDTGWIVWSPGPDGKFDMDWTVYISRIPQPSPELVAYAYDTTNGVLSGGDVWRVKQ